MQIAKGIQKYDLHIEVSIAPHDKGGFTNFAKIDIEPGQVIKSITVSHNYVPNMKTRSVVYTYYAPRLPDSEEEPVLIYRKTEELNMAIYDYNYE